MRRIRANYAHLGCRYLGSDREHRLRGIPRDTLGSCDCGVEREGTDFQGATIVGSDIFAGNGRIVDPLDGHFAIPLADLTRAKAGLEVRPIESMRWQQDDCGAAIFRCMLSSWHLLPSLSQLL